MPPKCPDSGEKWRKCQCDTCEDCGEHKEDCGCQGDDPVASWYASNPDPMVYGECD